MTTSVSRMGFPRVRLRVPPVWLAVDPRDSKEVQRIADLCGDGVEALKALELVPDSTTPVSFSSEVADALVHFAESGVSYCMLRYPDAPEDLPDAMSVHMELAVKRVENLSEISPELLQQTLVEEIEREQATSDVTSSQLTSVDDLPIYRLSWDVTTTGGQSVEGHRRVVQYVQSAEEFNAVIVSTFSVFSRSAAAGMDAEFDQIASSVSLVP